MLQYAMLSRRDAHKLVRQHRRQLLPENPRLLVLVYLNTALCDLRLRDLLESQLPARGLHRVQTGLEFGHIRHQLALSCQRRVTLLMGTTRRHRRRN